MIKENEDSLKQNHDNQVTQTAERAEANRAYQTNIKNVVVAQGLLKKAVDVLKKYYAQFEKEEEEKFLQTNEDPEPPETWEEEEGKGGYAGQRDAGGDVIKTLEFIQEESKKEEHEAHSDE